MVRRINPKGTHPSDYMYGVANPHGTTHVAIHCIEERQGSAELCLHRACISSVISGESRADPSIVLSAKKFGASSRALFSGSRQLHVARKRRLRGTTRFLHLLRSSAHGPIKLFCLPSCLFSFLPPSSFCISPPALFFFSAEVVLHFAAHVRGVRPYVNQRCFLQHALYPCTKLAIEQQPLV